jgi:tetratricopeptide (TPR) repeat protein
LLKATYQKTGQQVPLTDQITVYLNLGACYVSLGNFVKGYQQLDKGLELTASNPTLQDLKVKLWVAKANALAKENKTEEAYSLLKQAESTLLQQKNRPVLMVVEALLAGLEERKSNYQKAIEIYSQLYQTAIELENVKMKKEFSQSLYKNYERLQQSDSAIKYLNLFTAHEKEANSIQAKETLFRKELLQEFSEREKKLIATTNNRMRYLIAGASVLLIFLLGWLLFFRGKYRQADLQKLKLQLEAERRDLEQKQLQAQVAHQEKQLADLEYQLSKNAMLGNLVTELQSLGAEEKAPNKEEAKTTEGVKESHQTKIWDEFEIRFLKTHAGFFDRLMSAYPGLTVNERRLCAFLRLDMTTKEISVITGQSIRAIEIARTRLRKKLNLTETEKTLFEQLSSF